MADDIDPYYTWLGIPPKDQPPNHYRLLGLELFESNPDVIENAADRQMAHVRTVGSARHQDASQRVLNEIAAARICLLSEEKKAAYDGELRAKIAPKATREVRRATPLPDGNAAAPPGPIVAPPSPIVAPPGPIVRPLYAQEPQDPAPSPPGIALPGGSAAGGVTPASSAGYSLAPQTSRSTLSRRQRPALMPIIALGAALGLAVVVGLWFVLRGGGSTRDPIAQKSGKSSSQNGGDKKPDDLGTKSPLEIPVEGKTSPTSEIKQPIEPAANPAELPRHALRFTDQARVELTNTADLLGLLSAYTVEVWVRPRSADATHPIVGNLVVGKLHPDVADDEFHGWMLATTKPSAGAMPVVVARGERGNGGRLSPAVLGQWVHVAVTFESERQMIYANGRRLSTAKVALPPASKSNLCLGVPPYGGEAGQVRFDGDICGLRVSNGVRYPQAFTPARQFAADAETLLLLDFNQQGSSEVRDLAGKNYHGRVVGATWIATSGDTEPLINFQATDLLQLVDVQRDAVAGEWKREDQGFNCDASRAARLMLPVIPQGDYELEVEFTRRDGKESINLILPIGNRQVQFVLEGYPHISPCAGLDLVDGQYAYRNPTTVAPFSLENGRRYRTAVKVIRANGNVTIEAHLDGKKLLTWTGAETSLALLAAYQLPNRRCPGLMSYESAATFHSARLRMFSGQVAVVRKTASKPSKGKPETAKPKFSSGVANKPKPSRATALKGAALETARRIVRDLFPDDVVAATTPAKKEALARKLLDRANERRDSRDRIYALLYEARETAIAALDVETAVKASEQMAAGYDVDGTASLLEVFTRLSAANLTAEKRKALVDAMLGAADHAAGEEDFTAASELLAVVTKTLAKTNDPDLRRKAAAMKDQIEQTQAWFEEAQAARAVLTDKPDDGAANRALGKYLCFVSDDWENGLPHLAKAGDAKADDAKLRAAAELEQGPPDTAAAQAKAGDAWWDLATPATGYWKLALHKRAEHWYQKAVEGLSDPAKGNVQKRLAILEKSLGDAGDASTAALSKRIVGDFFLVATGKKNSRMTATMAFAADGAVSDNQLPVGRWAIESGQVRITFNDSARGAVTLRSRGKDTFLGLAKSETPNWELKRVVVVAVWNVSVEGLSVADQRLTLYSNGKGNDIYGNATWSLSGNNLSINWPEYRGLGLGLQGVFRIEPGGKAFRSQEPRLRMFRGERVASPDAKP